MAEYINKQTLEEFFSRLRSKLHPEMYKTATEFFTRDEMLLNVQQHIHMMPPADVAPVRRGRWIYGTDEETGEQDIVAWTCSLCGEKTQWQPRYCMHCGARMDGEQDG